MKKMISLFALALMVVFTSCKESEQATSPISKESVNILDDFMKEKNKLLEKGVVAEIGIKKSQDLSMGITQAEQDARAKIGRAIESKTSSVLKQFNEEVNNEFLEHTSSVNKTVSSQLLLATTVVKQDTEKLKNGMVQIYVLMVVDPQAFSEALKLNMQANENMKVRWMSSKAQEELTQDIAEYEAWKKENTPKM